MTVCEVKLLKKKSVSLYHIFPMKRMINTESKLNVHVSSFFLLYHYIS